MPYVTEKQAAKYYKVKPATMRKMAQLGKVDRFKFERESDKRPVWHYLIPADYSRLSTVDFCQTKDDDKVTFKDCHGFEDGKIYTVKVKSALVEIGIIPTAPIKIPCGTVPHNGDIALLFSAASVVSIVTSILVAIW